ncbi:HAD family hydrolase [Yinghuangia seranimata]|uniref:HAD family hydrolase n=1 Tax=Yinghuangia seranimata TaxID=408067 RepID=UPI00248BD5D1|nr:HAD family hydrolase [Yinghuangia seranimata]MDI2131917.1 HAD family hydrolase [Yinghuangia seranimata]
MYVVTATPSAPPPSTPRPRLVATDLDGTIVRSDGTISERTLAALDAVEAAGGAVVFVTGRPPRWMDKVAQVTGHHGLAICGNGAVVYDLRAEQIVDTHPMDVTAARKVIALIREHVPDVCFAVETATGFAHEPEYPPLERDLSIVHAVAPAEELLDGPVLKLLARHPSMAPDDFLAVTREAAGAHAEFTHSSKIALVEISALGVSKASTLAWFCTRHGITADEVVAFGDMPNDLPMLGWAGHSYAVANAHPAVLAAVPNHTASNDDDGVAQIIEKLFP